MATTKQRGPIEELRKARHWPKGMPMPKAGPYRRYAKWTSKEDDAVRKYYPKYGWRYVARLLGRTQSGVVRRAAMLGVADTPRQPWAPQEEAMLQELLPMLRLSEVARKLGRTISSVQGHMRKLELMRPEKHRGRVWTTQEDRIIRKLVWKVPREQIAERLDRTVRSLNNRIEHLGLTDPRRSGKRRPWSARENAMLRKMIGTGTFREIASRIRRPVTTVQRQVKILGLSSLVGNQKRRWTPEEDARLRKLVGTMPMVKLAAILGRHKSSLRDRIKKLELFTNQ